MHNFVCSSSKCHLPVTPQHGRIIVHGAHAHNLKGVCFEIPKTRLVAFTGLSGSGKSSIAVDVLASECVRQLLGGYGLVTDHIPKPRVDTVLGLSPAITISQRKTDFNSRSLVGTKTGILTLLRNLFATIGYQQCSGCDAEVKQPLQGKHKLTTVETEERNTAYSSTKKSYFGCPHCKEQLEILQMSHFSPNAVSGICESCKGIGETLDVDISSLLDGEKTIINGGVRYWESGVATHYTKVIEAASKSYNFPFDQDLPIKSYSEELHNFLLYGITYPNFVKSHKGLKEPKKVGEGKFEGIVPHLMTQYKKNPSKAPDSVTKFMVRSACPSCNNARLGKLGREVTVGGKTITEVNALSLSELLKWLETLERILPKDELQAYTAFSNGLQERASNLIEVGLHYLTLDRTLPSLSAGEAQRLRLADALGSSSLTGVLYILDEPTTGLHPHDTAKLLKTLRRIQENDNTVVVIEHDLDVIKSADYIIDVGPGRGTQGGEIVGFGMPTEVMACEKSITGKHLARKAAIKLDPPTQGDGKAITIRGASENNLKNIDVSIPTQQLVVLTGVSGSRKSTFLFGILDKVTRNHFNKAKELPGKHTSVEGLENVKRVVTVNQSTIGSKSSRSNVATYTNLFDSIRDLFASLPESKKRDFGANAFSFNASDERCENCNGSGVVQVDMSFMPGVEMDCSSCAGMRFNDDLLAVKFAEYNIAEILDLTVSDEIPVFDKQKKILEVLKLMQRVGLEHLKLGQSTSTLSGGEAQRIKLASELSKASKQKTLFLLDEPTTGLHCEEVGLLLNILRELVSTGHTVAVIEHNLDVMCRADTIIDFGPRGGTAGGTVVARGTVQEVCESKSSITGQSLKTHLDSNL
ncbi:excinuclease ABC subunit UvrA [Candidatus Tisiphia endosymbiont of Myopa tessellatipennis]|uniref:excinuclease ABC subunit UvrA n=1 Tax=Candidatus Tisiphia endosymbiont of Myopa tessellatipennis TaxID=3066257 RepID=UPI00313C8DA5